MGRRADAVDRTRERITEATVRLHTTIGPAGASYRAIADEAGVTRLTLYRHFPDRDELFEACMSHWAARHPGPDIEAWRRIPLDDGRMRTALRELYAWFAEHGDDLVPIYRDWAAWPDSARARADSERRAMAGALLDGVRSGTRARKRAEAAVNHVLHVDTWRSLAVGQGLSLDDAVELASGFVRSALEPSA